MKVLTSNGFKHFDGVKVTHGYTSLLQITTNAERILKCTNNHLIRLSNEEFIKAESLKVGDYLTEKEYISDIKVIDYDKPVYDLINVQDGNHYLTNGIISHNCIFLDEAAFIPENHWIEFSRSVFPTISSGTETKVIMVSTFNGQNHFYNDWIAANSNSSSYYPSRVDWWDVPGRDENWKKEQLKNMSEEDFAQEYGNEALGSGNTLLSSRGFSILERTVKEPIQFTLNTKIYEAPIYGHTYFMTCDCADTGIDYSTISVIDISEFPYKQVAIYRDNKVSHLQFPHIIFQMGMKYNKCAVLVESNDVGKVILHILNYDMEYDNIISTKIHSKLHLGQLTTAKTKSIGCARLKDMVESEQLIIPNKNTYDEFKHFAINSAGSSYEGIDGSHDDMVMGLVNFAYYASTPAFRMQYDKNFLDSMATQYEEDVLEALAPLPMFSGTQAHNFDEEDKSFYLD